MVLDKIGLDMDEVTAQLMVKLIDFHNVNYDTNLTKHDFKTYSLKDTVKISAEESTDRLRKFFSSDQFYSIEPVKYSQEAISTLASKYELPVITARPHIITADTANWANTYFPDKFSSITLTNQWHGEGQQRKKSEVCKELGVNLMIDDSLKHAYDCAENGIDVLLFDINYPWNNKDDLHTRITRVHSWEDALKEIDNYDRKR